MKRNFLTLGLLSLALAACSGGENGIDGKDGKDGDSCTITNNEDGTATITCPDGSSFTIKNGEDGKKGDAGSDGEKGQNGQSCKLVENIDGSQAVVCPYDGSSYIVRGNTDHYVNYCAQGFYGKNCENECSCNDHQYCNDGATGDGSCTCKDLWIGQDCTQCDLTKAYGSNCTPYGSFTDKEGNTYKTVIINNQEWMAENLKATKDINDNDVTCYAATFIDPDFVKNYGCLYIWEDAKKVCPNSWHLPDKSDFDNLLINTETESNSANICSGSDSSNSSGFGALFAGSMYSKTGSRDFGTYAYFWSTTQYNGQKSYYLEINVNIAIMRYFAYDVSNAFSVRCLKD